MDNAKDTVKKVAKLARLGISEAEQEKVAPQFDNILDWINQLSELNTDGVEPLANVAAIDLKKRVDEINDGDIQKDVLQNSPESQEGFFVVPKVVE